MARASKSMCLVGVAGTAAMLGACSAVESTSTDRFTASGEMVALSGGPAGAANACFTCHGLDGLGDGAGSPRLAGLEPGYLERQLEAYADGRRKHPQMRWIARNLSPEDRHSVAGYYAAMAYAPVAMPDIPAPVLYVRGDPERDLPACASCHGLRGQGIGPANPPLGGQPGPYLAGQVIEWVHARRRNDPGNVMLHISQRLTPAETAVLSAYAARLPGGPPGPGSPEAFPEARRAGLQSDVSERLLHVPESARAAER